MTPTMSEISIAVIMVAVTVAILVWFQPGSVALSPYSAWNSPAWAGATGPIGLAAPASGTGYMVTSPRHSIGTWPEGWPGRFSKS